MQNFFVVCLGGAIGTGMRQLVNLAAYRWLGVGWPLGTFAVNVVGSFLLAAVSEAALRGIVPPEVRAVLAVGVLGGFTTYSSFNGELLGGIARGAWGWSVVYAAATLVGCLLSGAAGAWAARAAFPG